MSQHFTSLTFPDGRPMVVQFGNKFVTAHGGAAIIMANLRKKGIFAAICSVLEKYLPRPLLPFQYTQEDLFEQQFLGILTGKPKFSDAKDMKIDKYLDTSLRHGFASGSTLSRNAKRIEEFLSTEQQAALKRENLTEPGKTDVHYITTPMMTELNFCLLDACLKCLKKYYKLNPSSYIIIDVDGTPIPLYGQQQMLAYDGHYQCNCYLPIFITINGYPAFIQNAPGAANGAALLLNHIDEILDRVKKAFPNKTVVVRGDTGYNNDALMQKISDKGCFFIFGANAGGGKGQTKQLKEQVLRDFLNKSADASVIAGIPEEVLEYLDPSRFVLSKQKGTDSNGSFPAGTKKFRCCGILRDYHPSSWKAERTYVCYRLQYNSNYRNTEEGGVNIRYIQTNLTSKDLLAITGDRGQRKARASTEACLETDKEKAQLAIEFYEALFCDRGMDERLNCEWKSHCYASCCSCHGFFSNSFLMLLSGFAMLALICLRQRIFPFAEPPSGGHRNSTKPNVTQAHKAEKIHVGPTIDTIRRFLINIPAIVTFQKRRCVISFGPMSEFWANALRRMIS